METTVDKVSDLAHEAVDKVTDLTNQGVDKLSEKGEQLKNVEQRLRNEYSEYIRDNPLTSVGIAVGVGFVLSRLLSNR
jgi:ElaB/YqjD/DUF883 family membrane-anchored ribosome-binding protein